MIEISDELHDLSDAIIMLIDIDADIIEFASLIPIIFGMLILSEDDDRQADGLSIGFLMPDIRSGRIIIAEEDDSDICIPITENLSLFLDKLLFERKG